MPRILNYSRMYSMPDQEDIKKLHGIYFSILTIGNGKIVNGESMAKRRILVLEPLNDDPMLAKFNLEVPDDGQYKLYCSYFMTPSSGDIKFMQRQDILSDWKNIDHPDELFVKK
jgi:hypothetical protein